MISIVTPTYNRAYLLPRLYKSLLSQTKKNFEWIIVDDGSIDDTKELVEKWKKSSTNSIDILYIQKENGGKHRALNTGIPYAKYEYVFVVDSDDYLVKEAIDLIQKQLEKVNKTKNIAGVSGLKGKINDSNQKIIPLGEFPENVKSIDATNLERRKYKLGGDKAEVYRKDLLLNFPFPEFKNEKFIGEDSVWNEIAIQGYKIRWFNDILCVCEYLDDGLTNQGSLYRNLSNFEGYTYTEKIKVHFEKFPYNMLAVGRYIRLAKKKNLNFKEIKEKLDIKNNMLICGVIIGRVRELVRKFWN